jgi:integrase
VTGQPDLENADQPCRVRGAGQDHSAERPIATVAQVAALAKAVDERLWALVLLAAWCGLRRAELRGLRRRDLDLLHGTVRVERSMHTLRDNSIVVGPPENRRRAADGRDPAPYRP